MHSSNASWSGCWVQPPKGFAPIDRCVKPAKLLTLMLGLTVMLPALAHSESKLHASAEQTAWFQEGFPAETSFSVLQPLALELGMANLSMRDLRSRNRTRMFFNDDSIVWTRFLASDIHYGYQASNAPTVQGKLGGLQVGVTLWQNNPFAGHHEQLGIYAAQSRVNVTTDGRTNSTDTLRSLLGKARLNATSLGLYWTHTADDAFYVDTTAQATRYDGNATGRSGSLGVQGYGLLMSIEMGYPFELTDNQFTLEPQAQLIGQNTRFQASNVNSYQVSLGNMIGLTGRVGVKAKWMFETPAAGLVEPFIDINYWRDWNALAKTQYDIANSTSLASSADRISSNIGVVTLLNRDISLSGSMGYQTSLSRSDVKKRDNYLAAIGLGYSF